MKKSSPTPPPFMDLNFIHEDFVSYKSLVRSFNNHISQKNGNSYQTYDHELYLELYKIEHDLWNNQRDEDYINSIILRLNIIMENCQKLISEIKAEIESFLETNNEGFSSSEKFYEKLYRHEIDFMNKIKDINLQNSSNYLLVAVHSRFTLLDLLDKIKPFSQKGTENRIQHNLRWLKSDTDFLELVTSLFESKSINNESKDLTRKDAIIILSQIFNLEIKDVESKLVRATERKKDTSPFLGMLKKEFDDYSQKKVKE